MAQRDKEKLIRLVAKAEKTAGEKPVSKTQEEAVQALCRALAGRGGMPKKPELARARSLASKLELVASKSSDSETTRQVRKYLYELYTAMHERGRAREQAGLINGMCGESEDFRVRAEGLILLAKACYWSDDQRGAVAFQREALNIVDRARERGETDIRDERRFNRHYTIWAFRYAQNTCRWDEADFTFQQACSAARVWNESDLIADAQVLYSEAKMFQGEWAECERLAGECAKSAMYARGGPQSCYPFWIWGRALVYLGRPETALPVLDRAIRIGRGTGDAVGLSESLISRAEASLALGRNAEALEMAAESEKIAEGAAMELNLAQVRLWRAWIEMEADPALAERHIEPIHLSLARFERCGTLSGWATAVHALGHALVLAGFPEAAGTYLDLAVERFREWNMPWHESRAVGSIRLARGKRENESTSSRLE